MSVIRTAFFARLMQTTCVGFALAGVLLTTGCAHQSVVSSDPLAATEASKSRIALATALQSFASPEQSFAYAQGVDINQLVVPGADLSSTLAPVNLQSRSIGPVVFIEPAPIVEKQVEAPVVTPVAAPVETPVAPPQAEELVVPAAPETPPQVMAPPMVETPAPQAPAPQAEVKLAEAHDAAPLSLTPPAPEPTQAAAIVEAPASAPALVEEKLPAGTKPLELPPRLAEPAPVAPPPAPPVVAEKPVEPKLPVVETAPVVLAPAPQPVAPPPVVAPPVATKMPDGTKPLVAPAEVPPAAAVVAAPMPAPVPAPVVEAKPAAPVEGTISPVEEAVANANEAIELSANMGVASQVVVQPSTAGVNLWQAQAGQTLHEVLTQWCARANVQLVWSSEYDFPLGASIALNDNFENAVRTVLTGLSAASPQPIGNLHRQANTGSSVLIIETRGNMYEDQ